MKKLIYIIPLLLLFNSCKKFLTVEPEQQTDQSVAITNAASALTAVNGMYNTLGNSNYYGSNYPALSYLAGGDIQWTGSQADASSINKHLTSSANSYVDGAWIQIYKTILSANYLIADVDGVQDPLFTTALRQQYKGEAFFVRALSYFDLARGWGGVQLILKPTLQASDNLGIKRSSLADTYAQVLNDLDSAEILLTASKVAVNKNRANPATVWALKARFYLYNQQWALAEQYATMVISDTQDFGLVTPFNAFFAGNAVATKESVFEIAYTVSNTNNHSNWWLPPALGGRREWAPTDNLVALLNNPAIGGNRSALIAQTAPPGNLWYGQLYYRQPLGTDPAYVIRLSEVYLIRSEARAEQSDFTDALTDLNAVRTRAGVPPSTAASLADFQIALENERQVEFPFETDRFFNLVRTGRAQTVLSLPDTHLYLFPIPQTEQLADPDNLGGSNANPGY